MPRLVLLAVLVERLLHPLELILERLRPGVFLAVVLAQALGEPRSVRVRDDDHVHDVDDVGHLLEELRVVAKRDHLYDGRQRAHEHDVCELRAVHGKEKVGPLHRIDLLAEREPVKLDLRDLSDLEAQLGAFLQNRLADALDVGERAALPHAALDDLAVAVEDGDGDFAAGARGLENLVALPGLVHLVDHGVGYDGAADGDDAVVAHRVLAGRGRRVFVEHLGAVGERREQLDVLADPVRLRGLPGLLVEPHRGPERVHAGDDARRRVIRGDALHGGVLGGDRAKHDEVRPRVHEEVRHVLPRDLQPKHVEVRAECLLRRILHEVLFLHRALEHQPVAMDAALPQDLRVRAHPRRQV
mmetsp:Transcript_9746/g.24504  ORF Transcript_9746/g.24504 Transcript_9746/m.24504 type:complete len:357 (+) Transcript_9746:471-1541(+)